MTWFKRIKPEVINVKPIQKLVPDGTWLKCIKCNEMYPAKELEDNLNVCPLCGYHNRIKSSQWIKVLCDNGSFISMFEEIVSDDPLEFVDSKPYTKRIEESKQKSNVSDAIICGESKICNHRVSLGVMDFFFMGGSMGSVVGERFLRIVEFAILNSLPLITVSSSGGARMQEGLLSLMQLARTSAVISRFQKAGGFYISIMADPTTGGTTASFASLGDIILAEPGALIGFAGPRVIEQTIRQKLPPKFQTAEFLQEHGFVDCVVERKKLKKTIHLLIHSFIEHTPPDE
ncbi:MAG: acetyl-CoA carboxylase, carboxyltransferase subunit beta [Candidatus Hydrogenedentota bacterium]